VTEAAVHSTTRDDMLPLFTRRLTLRRFADSDVDVFRAYRNDRGVARFQDWDGCSLEEAVDIVRTHGGRAIAVPGQWLQIAIARTHDNGLIGDCAVKLHAADPMQATIGFTLAPTYQRQGFGTEALSRLLEHLFADMALHRVVADTDALNLPAARLLERLGMRREGHLRRSLWFKGRWADEYLYAILQDEWRAHRCRAGAKAATLLPAGRPSPRDDVREQTMRIELTAEDLELLREVVERTAAELREEVYKTEAAEWKRALKAREQVLAALRAKLGPA
jgi:RimJ/RimL family protein N-acetyltransferase